MSDNNLAIEYQRWVDVYSRIHNKILRMRLPSRRKYEFKNILERFFLRMANMAKPGEVYVNLSIEDEPYQYMLREFKEKGLLNEQTSKTFAHSVSEWIKHHLAGDTKTYDFTPELEGNTFKYGNFRMEVDERRKEILCKAKMSQILRMMIRYSLLFLGGQQWNLPFAWYKKTVEDFNIDIEGFASPLNSQTALMKDRPKFCSLFEDVDKPFGSIGSIFQLRAQRLKNKVMMNNPPYVIDIMDRLVEIQENWMKEEPIRIIMCVPAWEDANYYVNSMKSKYLKYEERLEPGKHYYETMGKKIVAKFPSHIFIFSSHKKEIPKLRELYSNITKIWRDV